MLKNELIDLINRNEVWAFVGSGPSVDSGYPSWDKLIDDILEGMKNRDSILNDIDFRRYRSRGNYPECFSIIENSSSREYIDKKVRDILSTPQKAGKIINYLAEFPFRGYITTNYDNLIESTLLNNHQYGWITVGNTQEEIIKTTGNPEKIVWHIHGSVKLAKEKSKLILTQKDYDNLYLVSNPIIDHIKHLLSQNRLLFVGFGFKDFELKRVLKEIGIFCSPTRPAYAFLGFEKEMKEEKLHDMMMKEYNIDLIDYEIDNNKHKKLTDLLQIYSSMILKRSQQFGAEKKKCPSYDPETTSLLIFNELVIKSNIKFDENMIMLFIQALILTLLKTRNNITIEELIELISSRINLLSSLNLSKLEESGELFRKVITDSLEKEFIQSNNIDANIKISLTPKGENYFRKNHGITERIKLQFISSTKSRLFDYKIEDDIQNNDISELILTFINDIIEKRSLGVQFASDAIEKDEKDYHILALMQSIPEYISQLENQKQALIFINVIKDVFSNPTEEERRYIGLSLQARFSIHLLGLDQDMLKLRIKELKNSFYIIDSSIMIPLLAISSSAHKSALKLIKSLKENDCMIVTTPLLDYEVCEHLCWAYNKAKSNNELSMLKYMQNKSGMRPNAFLNGYINEIASGSLNSFDLYLQKIFQIVRLKKINERDFEHHIGNSLSKYELNILDIRKITGFKDEFLFDIDENKGKIKEIRLRHNSFKHDRQVEAEAVALTMIKKIRNREMKLEDGKLKNGYFVSNTKILDELNEDELPIIMKPDTLLQIVASLDNWSIDELGYLTDSLVSEFQGQVLNIIDYRKLRLIFSPYIRASKDDYKEHYEYFKNIYRLKYNEDLDKSIQNIDDTEFPIFWDNLISQITEDMREELNKVYDKLKEAEKKKYFISNKDWQMLWQYKEKKKLRRIKRIEKKNKK